jgi:hypothetical protein
VVGFLTRAEMTYLFQDHTVPLRLRFVGETVAFLRKCFILGRLHEGETQLALRLFQCMTIMRLEPSFGTSPLS